MQTNKVTHLVSERKGGQNEALSLAEFVAGMVSNCVDIATSVIQLHA